MLPSRTILRLKLVFKSLRPPVVRPIVRRALLLYPWTCPGTTDLKNGPEGNQKPDFDPHRADSKSTTDPSPFVSHHLKNGR